MSKILIHKNSNVHKIYLDHFIALIPLVIYGIYKNGLLLYFEGSINFISVFKPLFLPFIGVFFGFFVHYIFNKKIEINPLVLYGLIVGMIVPISTNIIIFIVLMFGLLLLTKYLENKITFNYICAIKLVIILALLIFNNYEYANIVEHSKDYAFSIIDIIFGRGVSGICSSSILWIILGYLYMTNNFYFKKEIPLYAVFGYVITTLVSYIFIKDFSIVLNNLLSASIFFAFVFIAPLSEFSCYTKKGKILYGILLGLLSGFLAILINPYEAAIIVILILSLFKEMLDKSYRRNITK